MQANPHAHHFQFLISKYVKCDQLHTQPTSYCDFTCRNVKLSIAKFTNAHAHHFLNPYSITSKLKYMSNREY